jgi:porphobilinogen synthase
MVMIKPGLAYLFNVNGERNGTFFSSSSKSFWRLCMIKAAAKRGWIDEEESKVNCFFSIKRAEANSIISYFSMDMTKYLEV